MLSSVRSRPNASLHLASFFAADHHVFSSTYTTSNVRSRAWFRMKLMSELLSPTTDR